MWLYGKCKRADQSVLQDDEVIQNYSYPRIIEDNTVSRTIDLQSNTTMGDAALRRGIQESRNQYENEILYRSQLDEAIRASNAEMNNNMVNRSATVPWTRPLSTVATTESVTVTNRPSSRPSNHETVYNVASSLNGSTEQTGTTSSTEVGLKIISIKHT